MTTFRIKDAEAVMPRYAPEGHSTIRSVWPLVLVDTSRGLAAGCGVRRAGQSVGKGAQPLIGARPHGRCAPCGADNATALALVQVREASRHLHTRRA